MTAPTNRRIVATATHIALLTIACAAPGPSPLARESSASVSRASDAAPSASNAAPTPSSTSAASPLPEEPSISPSPRLEGVFGAMLDAIVADRPTARLDLYPDRLDESWILDGNVDEGFGPSRLYIMVTPRRGDLTAHPCGDPDFRQRGACIEQDLPDGDRLVLRDRVTSGGVTTVLAVLIHPDRSGITAESSNMMIDLDPGPLGPGPRDPPVVNRPEPMYTARQLGALLLAIERRLTAAGLTTS